MHGALFLAAFLAALPLAITAPRPREPPAFIIGAMKSSTSALHSFLSKHPGVSKAVCQRNEPPYCSKELHFFQEPTRYARGLSFYFSHFPLSGRTPLDATPNYLPSIEAPGRIRDSFPNATYLRFVVLLRDPIERAESHFRHAAALAGSKSRFNQWATRLAGNRTFEQALDAAVDDFEECMEAAFGSVRAAWTRIESARLWRACGREGRSGIFSFGLYGPQLAHWRSIFPSLQHYCIIAQNLLAQEPDQVLGTVAAFLGLASFPAWKAHTRAPRPAVLKESPAVLRANKLYGLLDGGLFANASAAGITGCEPQAPRPAP